MRNFEVSPTIEEDLNQHFSCYGDVKNVFLDKEEVRENLKVHFSPIILLFKVIAWQFVAFLQTACSYRWMLQLQAVWRGAISRGGSSNHDGKPATFHYPAPVTLIISGELLNFTYRRSGMGCSAPKLMQITP